MADRYQEAWDTSTLAELLRGPGIDPAAVAVHDARGAWRYQELDAEADRIAGGLHALHVRRGDMVVVQLGNQHEFVTVCVALFRIGAIPVLAMPSLRGADIDHLLTVSGAGLIVAGDVMAGHDHRVMLQPFRDRAQIVVVGDAESFMSLDDLDGAAPTGPGPDPADTALMLLSGGTTHRSKLIPRTHRDYGFQIRHTASELGVTDDWTYLAAVPVAHNAALGCPGVLGLLRLGGQVVLSPTPAPDQTFPLLQRHLRSRQVITTLMPAILDVWTQCAAFLPVDLTGVVIEVGGAAMDRDRLAVAEAALGCTVTRWFGMAEGPLCFTRQDDTDRLDHEGRPLSPWDRYRIVGADGAVLGTGEVGEIHASGPTVIQGYFGEQGPSSHVTADGYLQTGDQGWLDDSAHLHVGGRLDDVINRGGEKIAPEEVESHLRALNMFDDVAVVGAADSLLGQRVVACVVTRTNPEPGQVRAALRTRGVAEYKLPSSIVVLNSIPRTAIGKTNRQALLARISDLT